MHSSQTIFTHVFRNVEEVLLPLTLTNCTPCIFSNRFQTHSSLSAQTVLFMSCIHPTCVYIMLLCLLMIVMDVFLSKSKIFLISELDLRRTKAAYSYWVHGSR